MASTHNLYDSQPTPTNNRQSNNQGWRDNQQNRWNPPQQSHQRYQSPHTRQNPQFSVGQSLADDALRTLQQESRELKEAQKRTDAQISNLTDLITYFTTRVMGNQQSPSQSSSSTPIPSQPLPNPKHDQTNLFETSLVSSLMDKRQVYRIVQVIPR
ncbi:hypothetical protein PIB30_022485 [Stylosanthes scabra]|uniref:Uncharacterized protein n=1 Tax=Stylosanthes scabra TaxID=79078 RepID=A0ABU6U8G1_9FABA|nr:hypothetical protein [Stylosanthes scabra]